MRPNLPPQPTRLLCSLFVMSHRFAQKLSWLNVVQSCQRHFCTKATISLKELNDFCLIDQPADFLVHGRGSFPDSEADPKIKWNWSDNETTFNFFPCSLSLSLSLRLSLPLSLSLQKCPLLYFNVFPSLNGCPVLDFKNEMA